VGNVLHAIRVFFETLAAVKFTALGLAVICHLLKTMCTSRAWRNTIAASYPEEEVRWRSVYAAYLAGVGVNAIIPARAGDAVRLYLTHRAVPATTYTTLVATLLVLTVFDMAMAVIIFAYALTLGVLPGIGSLGSLPGFDFGFFVSNPEFSAVLLVVLVIFGTIVFGLGSTSTSSSSASARASQSFVTARSTSSTSHSGRPVTGSFASSRSGSSSTRSESTSRSGTCSSCR
jgi:hypothetical protein